MHSGQSRVRTHFERLKLTSGSVPNSEREAMDSDGTSRRENRSHSLQSRFAQTLFEFMQKRKLQLAAEVARTALHDPKSRVQET